jgi:hypothetical protein
MSVAQQAFYMPHMIMTLNYQWNEEGIIPSVIYLKSEAYSG